MIIGVGHPPITYKPSEWTWERRCDCKCIWMTPPVNLLTYHSLEQGKHTILQGSACAQRRVAFRSRGERLHYRFFQGFRPRPALPPRGPETTFHASNGTCSCLGSAEIQPELDSRWTGGFQINLKLEPSILATEQQSTGCSCKMGRRYARYLPSGHSGMHSSSRVPTPQLQYIIVQLVLLEAD